MFLASPPCFSAQHGHNIWSRATANFDTGEHLRNDGRDTGNFGYDAHRNSDGPAGQRQYDNGGESSRDTQQGWAPQGQTNSFSYEYTGYHFEGPASNRSDLEHLARGFGIPQGGFVPHQYLPPNTLAMNQLGAGMKWYPDKQGQLPVLPPFPSGPTPSTVSTIMAAPQSSQAAEAFSPVQVSPKHISPLSIYQETFPRYFRKKAASEPAESRFYPHSSTSSESNRVLNEDEDVDFPEEDSPVVVSSSTEVNSISM